MRVFSATAHLYDLIYGAAGKDYAAESAEVHRLIQQRRPGARSLLDVACGTGGHLRHLRQWYDVTGVDVDPAMLDEAARHLPGVPLVAQDMRSLALDTTFDAVVCLFSSIGYLADRHELDDAGRAMAGHLAEGGVIVVDGWVRPEAWRDGEGVHVETAADDTTTVVRMTTSRRVGTATHLVMHHLMGTHDGIEHVVETHRLTLFAPEDYEAALRGAGLRLETVPGPMPGRDRYVGVKEGGS